MTAKKDNIKWVTAKFDTTALDSMSFEKLKEVVLEADRALQNGYWKEFYVELEQGGYTESWNAYLYGRRAENQTEKDLREKAQAEYDNKMEEYEKKQYEELKKKFEK